eukprot:347005-Pelagomonas_calceolata.AAC.2
MNEFKVDVPVPADEAIESDVPVAVCSTSNERAVSTIVKVLLGPEIAARMRVFAGDIVPKKKPDPAIYLLAAKELGVNPENCCVVEDSRIGMQENEIHWLRRAGSPPESYEQKGLLGIWRVTGSAPLQNLAARSTFAFNSASSGNQSVGILTDDHGAYAAKAAGMVCLVTKSSYTQHEDFSEADGVYAEIGEKGSEKFTVNGTIKLLVSFR